MKIWIHSCHAVLEYDQAKMFGELGHEVSGIFDVGSEQRPKIEGVTDRSQPEHGDPDVFVIHQMEDFHTKAKEYASLGKPVILMAFGQGSREQHKYVAQLMGEMPNLYLCAYSVKEHTIYAEEGAPREQSKMIRFGKDLKEFGNWRGDLGGVLVMCNDIQNRGDACGWDVVKELAQMGVPIVMAGKNTGGQHVVSGFGEVHFSELKKLMQRYRVAFNVGTKPAPYTLSLVEQICTGMPVIAWDNGCGIGQECMEVHTVQTVAEAGAALERVLTDDGNAKVLHEKSVEIQRNFDMKPVKALWQKLLEEIEGKGL